MRSDCKITFIADEKIRDFFFLYQREDLPIHVGQSERVIDHKQRNVRFVQHLIGLLDPELTQSPLVVKPRRVNDNNGA